MTDDFTLDVTAIRDRARQQLDEGPVALDFGPDHLSERSPIEYETVDDDDAI